METVTQKQANAFYAATKYIFQAQKTCNEKCVVDFQTPDLGAMEKECANACIRKHMAIFKDIVKE